MTILHDEQQGFPEVRGIDRPKEPGQCMVTGKPSKGRVVFAKAY